MPSREIFIEETNIRMPNGQIVDADIYFTVWVPSDLDWHPETSDPFDVTIVEDGEIAAVVKMSPADPTARRWVRDNADRIWNQIERTL